jgi:hypothetical protein
MTKDVEDLLNFTESQREQLALCDAAWVTRDELERLSSLSVRVEELEKALRPFAEVLKGNYTHQSNAMSIVAGHNANDLRFTFSLRDFRRAAELTRLRTAAVDNDSVRGREGE